MKQIGNYLIDTDLFYDPKNHFWLRQNQNFVRIGFSPLLQETSGSFVAILFENINQYLEKGASFGSVEAEKHVAQLILPIDGKIIVFNEKVVENPRLMNDDPYGEGWLVEVEMTKTNLNDHNLIYGEDPITKWVETETKKYEDKGWIARP